ncbi:hypothetical protein JAAARDRAFT_713918 [Jaapia argillacea MUCL 33604]|uniref:Uncharacterized protein n=1 Tax=Jaapia argillacea MUCL 33604 TaxID=933084 RepID=A0A067QAN0_9AGAM|nr:hypothetical protein JAAARDRAFT_713918 [Jaapia argillacea MUCL 33604]
MSIWETFVKVVVATRRIMWLYAPFNFLFGYVEGKGDLVQPELWIQLLILTCPFSTIAIGVNSVYDYDTDVHNHRKSPDSVFHGKVLEPRFHGRVLSAACIATVAVISSSLLAPLSTRREYAVVATLAISLGWFYSAGPRFKALPILDCVCVGAVCFLLSCAGFTFTGRSLLEEFPYHCGLLGLCIAGVQLVTGADDYEPDLAAGLKTTATVCGKMCTLSVGLLIHLFVCLVDQGSTFCGWYALGGVVIIAFGMCQNGKRLGLAYPLILIWGAFLTTVYFFPRALQLLYHFSSLRSVGKESADTFST